MRHNSATSTCGLTALVVDEHPAYTLAGVGLPLCYLGNSQCPLNSVRRSPECILLI